MNAITNWQLSIDGVGTVQEGTGHFRYAGGFVLAGLFAGGGESWAVYDLGNSEIALAVTIQDQDGNNWTYYCNSSHAMSSSDNNAGMMLWVDPDYTSDSIGPEQTFRIANLGQSTISLQATAGAFPGQYLSAQEGGGYPINWKLGDGSFISSPTPVPIRVGGDLLPLLLITNSGYDTDFTGRDLGTTNLANTNLVKCTLSGANLTAVASISGADFTSARLRGVLLGAHDLATAKTWAHADFTGTDLTTITGAAAAHLENAILDGANLTGRNLRGAFLQGASLKGTVLTGADLTGAHLESADLTGAHMGATILTGATLTGTHFDNVDLSTTVFDAAPNFTRAAAGRTTFVGATVPFAVLSNNWSYLDLTGATITGIPAAINKLVADRALLPDGLNLQGTDLTGASFVNTRMYEVQLQKANLYAAVLTSALLKGAKLNGANLTLANFDSAFLTAEQAAGQAPFLGDKLEAAVVTNAFLFNTILDGAHCDGVDFSGSLFVTATTLSPTQTASAVGASMNFAKFDEGACVAAVFNGAQLSAASFASTDLVAASFQDNGANPTQLTPSSDVTHTPASVYKADIRGTNFTGANMDGLDMREATYATTDGPFQKVYDGFAGSKVPVAFDYNPTLLGVTTNSTTCPDGNVGPCTLHP